MRKRLFLLLLVAACVAEAIAQTLNVKGVVLYDNEEVVIGASVMIKGTKKGVNTNINGEFELKGLTPRDRIVISYIGMKTQTLVPKPSMRVVLESDNQMLDEVMVVAYGEREQSPSPGPRWRTHRDMSINMTRTARRCQASRQTTGSQSPDCP